MSYLVIKSLHVVGVVAWFAALFYIFRLYVYHVENQGSPEICALLEIMERRLENAIMMPAFVFTLIMGIAMLSLNSGLLQTQWFPLKLLFVMPLFGYHVFASYVRREFARKNFFLTSKQCRIINEIPALILLVVVPLAIIKPF